MRNKKKLKVLSLLKKLRLRTLIALGVIIVIIPVLLFSIFKPGNTSAAWFNDAWSYRQKITITNNGSTSTTYPIRVSMDTSTLVTAGKMQSDCDDLRITDTNGKVLPIFIEVGCNTTYTAIWVQTTANATDTFYAYYGNRTASAVSSYFSYKNGVNPGTGVDGSVTVSSNKNINTDSQISGRSCADGGDGVNYSVTASTSSGQNQITLSSTPSSGCLAAGDEVLIINLQGTSADNANAGQYDVARITSIATATLTLNHNLENAYNGTTQKIMVQRIPNYSSLTVNSSTTFTAADWNGTKGGVIAMRVSGTLTVSASGGSITASSLGYRGGAGGGTGLNDGGVNAESYEGSNGKGATGNNNDQTNGGGKGGNASTASPNNGGVRGGGAGGGSAGDVDTAGASAAGGGGGYGGGGGGGGGGVDASSTAGNGGSGGTTGVSAGGGGGGCAGTTTTAGAGGAAGNAGSTANCSSANGVGGQVGSGTTGGSGGGGGNGPGAGGGGGGGGGTYGSSGFTNTIYLGSGGGGGGSHMNDTNPDVAGIAGSDGGGIVMIGADTVTVSGGIANNGGAATTSAAGTGEANGGGGAGGSIYISAKTATLGSSLVTATGGASSSGASREAGAGGGGVGRVNVTYSTTSGTTSPSDTSTAYPVASSPSSEEKGTGPVAYWHFDEATDNTCSGGTNDTCDVTTNANDGAISNATAWKTDEYCVSGKCLYFDGSNDIVTVTNASAVDLDGELAGGFTMEAWIRPNNAGEGSGGQIFFKSSTSFFRVDTLSSGRLDLQASLDLATTDATLNVSSAVPANQWSHVALTYTDDGDDEISIWVNGKLVGTSTDGVGAPAADSANLVIGGTTTDNYAGFMDEVKIYDYERSAIQMSSDSIISNQYRGASAGMDAINYNALSNGLVGYWKLEETATPALDSSGNSGSGTWTGGATVTNGKFGHGITLDGTGDYISVADSTVLSMTGSVSIASWVRPNSSIATKAIVVKDGSYRLVTDGSGNPICQVHNGSSWQTAATSSTALALSSYQFVACTYNGAVAKVYVNGEVTGMTEYAVSIADSANTLRIGNDSGGTYGDFNGRQDEVRVYNSALSDGDVRSLYSWAQGPIGYWNFDENTGTTTYDRSSNGNSGTITTNGGSAITPEWANGRVGSALKFTQVGGGANGGIVRWGDVNTLDFDANNSYTVSLWYYPRDIGSGSPNQTLFAKQNEGSTTNAGIDIRQNASSGAIYTNIADGTDRYSIVTTNTVEIYTWNHITIVHDRGTSFKIYVNGVEWTGTATGTLANVDSLANSISLCVGAGSSAANACGFNAGSTNIDEVKVYNYARTQSQILEDMNGGVNSGTVRGDNTPVARWRLDDIINNRSEDSSLNSGLQTLDAIGSPTIEEAGKSGRAVTFNGTSQYLSSADTEALSLTGSLSVSAWIKPSANTAATRYPIAGKATPTTISYLLEQYGDEIRMYIGSSSDYVTTNAADLQTSTWYHVLAAYNASAQTVTMYVNGKQMASTTSGSIPSSISDSNQGVAIGADDGSLTYVISANADDGTENSDTTWNASGIAGGVNGFGFYNGVYSNVNYGVRYQSIAIAQAATINASRLIVYSTTELSLGNTITDRIYADNVDNAAAWAAGSRPSTISNTTASADWNLSSWPAGAWLNSPSITAIVQEIVNRGSWASGNAMRFAVKRNGTTGQNILSTPDYARSPYYPARLVVNVNSASTKYFSGTIDDVKIYNSALTSAQVAFDLNSNASMNFSDSVKESALLTDGSGNGTVGYYPLDENNGLVTVYDKSGNGNDLTMNNLSTFGTSPWQLGKFGSALKFDGSNDTLSRADDSDFDFGTSSFTIGAWAKHPTIATNPDYLITKADTTNGGYKLYMDSSGNYCFAIDDDATWTPDDSACTSGTNYGDSAWHHVVGVKTTTSKIDIYVDGLLKTTDSSLAATSTLSNTNAMYIGADRDGTSNTWDGWVDEVKIYNYARTQSQISYDYNRGAPVGIWKFDECSGTTANDSTGNGNTGTITITTTGGNTNGVGSCTTSTSAWGTGASGKFNSSLNFDGDGDLVNVGHAASLDMTTDLTMSVWIKTSLTGTAQGIGGKDVSASTAGYNMRIDTSNHAVFFVADGSNQNSATSVKTVTDGLWHHIVGVNIGSNAYIYIDGILDNTHNGTMGSVSNASTDVKFGVRNSVYFSGQLDEARIYNYALSVSQIQKLYNDGAAVRFGPATGTPAP